MPYLSIVLPCYRVQAYVRHCLESILDQSFRDFEVIAINDASPDHTGEILDDYARQDVRLRVVHFPSNVGLGESRNVGMDRASGEYVMFVDSDDYLADGALESVAARLRETEPDVMFFDYRRVHWWGIAPANRAFLEEKFPRDVFTLRERPNALNLMMATWDRVYRRRFLSEVGQRFAPGFYEDLPVTFPALMMAQRISLLPRVVYYYRQRGIGAITRTVSREHFVVFDQYEKIFEFMDSHALELDDLRRAMVRRMIGHCFLILERGDRVPVKDRKEFFRRMAEMYRRHLPPGATRPSMREEPKERLLAAGAYHRYEAAVQVRAVTARNRRKVRALKRRIRQVKRALGRRVRIGQYKFHLRRPIDDDLAVFACYWYRPPACNPYAIWRKLQELAPTIRGVWVVRQSDRRRVPKDISYVVEGSPEYYRVLARAKFLVNNVNFPNFFVKRPNTIHLQTQHGTPLKTMGLDLHKYPVAAKGINFNLLAKRAARWDFNISSNQHSSEVWERVYPSSFQTLEYGYPRNDRFYTATDDEIRKIREDLDIPPRTTAILYAPTHREYRRSYEPQIDLSRISRALPPDQLLLVRAHYYYDTTGTSLRSDRPKNVLDVSKYPSTEDLCLASDVLLTDYSSIMCDYANLGRPVVIFADDYDTYCRLRGVYFDLLAHPPGIVAVTEAELIDVLSQKHFESTEAKLLLDAFRRRFCQWDDGQASERVVRRVFLNQEPGTPTPFDQRTIAPRPLSVSRTGPSPADRSMVPDQAPPASFSR